MTTSKFEYIRRLVNSHDASTIRILQLIPLSPDDNANDDSVSCALHYVDLDSVTIPKFTALSYCWGSTLQKSSITIEGKCLEIGKNLFDALRTLRDSRDAPVENVWADAVCINQDDITEKNLQVPLMGRIYRSAADVKIWLGAERPDEECVRVFDFFRRMDEIKQDWVWNLGIEGLSGHGSASSQQTLEESGEGRVSDGYDDCIDENEGDLVDTSNIDLDSSPLLMSLRTFFNNPWFQRTWIIQELILARIATFFYGHHASLSWDVFKRVVSREGSPFNRRKIPGLPGFSAQRLTELQDGRDISTSQEDDYLYKSLTMTEVLSLTRNSLATDPRDKMYALLGFVTGERPGRRVNIVPDYGPKNTKEMVFKHYVEECCRLGALDVLSIYNPARYERGGVPSWVTDWTLASDGKDMFSDANYEIRGYQ